jgi:hypothetical protein
MGYPKRRIADDNQGEESKLPRFLGDNGMFTWFQAGVIALAIVEREYLGIPSFPSKEAAVEFFAGLDWMSE